eukprot:COSAG02_NODE_37648_length_439_cov_0.800000_1_plen_53_part_10
MRGKVTLVEPQATLPWNALASAVGTATHARTPSEGGGGGGGGGRGGGGGGGGG